jgi:hypothetical protein
VQGLGDGLLSGREQLFTPHSDANIAPVARALAPAQYVQCTNSFYRVAPSEKLVQGMRAKHPRHRMQVMCSHTTDIGRTLAMEHVVRIGKLIALKDYIQVLMLAIVYLKARGALLKWSD